MYTTRDHYEDLYLFWVRHVGFSRDKCPKHLCNVYRKSIKVANHLHRMLSGKVGINHASKKRLDDLVNQVNKERWSLTVDQQGSLYQDIKTVSDAYFGLSKEEI